MLNKLYAYFLAIILLILPLFYSLDTQQIFSVNKFTLVLSFIGISAILFSNALLYNKNSLHISHNTLYSGIAICSILALSTYFSATPIISFFGSDNRHFGALFVLTLFLTFIFTSQIITNNSTKKIIIPFIFLPISISGIITAIWAILQYSGNPPLFDGILNFESLSSRSFAGMGQPNFCAQFLLFPFFITCYFLIKNFSKKNIYSVILHTNILILYIFALYTTGSRAGMLGIMSGIATLLVSYCAYYYKRKILQKGILFIILGILSLCLLIFLFGENIAQYLGSRGDSIAARFYFWNDAFELTKNFFWTGTGADMMNIPFAQSLSVQAFETENFYASPDRTHNILFDVFLQYGIFGFAFFIFGIWKTIHTAVHNISQSFQNNNKEIDTISIVALSAFIGILTTWIFGFAIITDSFLTIIFIAIIFRNSFINKKILVINKKYIAVIAITILISISFVLLHTAYTIHQSEKALFLLKNNSQLSRLEKYNLSEKILQTPYLAQNLFSVYTQFTDTQKIKAEKIAEKYNFQSSVYYQIKIFRLLSTDKTKEAYQYLQRLEKNAGNLFTKRIEVATIAKSYGLISDKEFQKQMQYITQNFIPRYYFQSEHYNDAKFKKFWKHHANNVKPLMKYKD